MDLKYPTTVYSFSDRSKSFKTSTLSKGMIWKPWRGLVRYGEEKQVCKYIEMKGGVEGVQYGKGEQDNSNTCSPPLPVYHHTYMAGSSLSPTLPVPPKSTPLFTTGVFDTPPPLIVTFHPPPLVITPNGRSQLKIILLYQPFSIELTIIYICY
jgi:hypothetical protein